MTGNKGALPGLATGGLGFCAGLCALVFDVPVWGAIAGLLALAAGAAGVRLAHRLEEESSNRTLIEAELEAERSRALTSSSEVETKPDTATATHDGAGDGALIDPTTGLFSESFFRVALDSRVAAARRHLRPVAVVFVEVVEGLPNGEPSIIDANQVTEAIRDTLREADTACRLRNGYFALLLEDTPENGAIWTVERIRRRLAQTRKDLTVWAGIACYPAHAFSSEEILDAAEQAIISAREWRQDRIEVAATAE